VSGRILGPNQRASASFTVAAPNRLLPPSNAPFVQSCSEIQFQRKLPDARGRGFASAIVAALLAWAREQAAACAFLQVNDDNAAALAVYRKFGFATVYTYHYRARAGECE